MSTESQFQRAYRAALKAAAKEERTKSGGRRLPEAQRHSVRFKAQQEAEEIMLSEHGRVTKSLVPKSYWYVIAQDTFMSGWGKAKGRSLYAVAAPSYEIAEIVAGNMENRSEMTRIRISRKLPSLKEGEHLHVVDHKEAGRFYRIGGFEAELNKRGRPVRRNKQYEFSRHTNRAFSAGYAAGLAGAPRVPVGDSYITVSRPDEFFRGYDLAKTLR